MMKNSNSLLSFSGISSQPLTSPRSDSGAALTASTSSGLAACPVSNVFTLLTYDSGATGSKVSAGSGSTSIGGVEPVASEVTQLSKQRRSSDDTPVLLPNGIMTPQGA